MIKRIIRLVVFAIVFSKFCIRNFDVPGDGGDDAPRPANDMVDCHDADLGFPIVKAADAIADPFAEELEADNEDIIKLVADWIDAGVCNHEYVSFPLVSSDERTLVVQRVDFHYSITLVRSFRGDISNVRVWNVQPFTIFHEATLPHNPSQMDVFLSQGILHSFILSILLHNNIHIDLASWCGKQSKATSKEPYA